MLYQQCPDSLKSHFFLFVNDRRTDQVNNFVGRIGRVDPNKIKVYLCVQGLRCSKFLMGIGIRLIDYL